MENFKEKPNILFISFAFYPQIGGIEVNSDILTAYFHKKGYPIKVVTRVKEDGEREFPFPVLRNPGFGKLLALHKWADVVFENNISLRLSWHRIFYRSISIITINGRVSREDGSISVRDRIKRMAFEKASEVIAVSGAMRDVFFPRATVIGNPYRNEIFKDLNRNRPQLSFVFLGRIVSEKGVHIAIEAIEKLTEYALHYDVKPTLRIIGDGPEMDKLTGLVRQKHLQNQISFEGRKEGDALVESLNACKYLLVPSANEGFGNVAIEGMACGCLPFVSDCGGLPEAIGDAGIKFKTFSTDALVSAIIEVLKNPDIEASYRSKMETHLAQHQPDKVAQKYLEVVERALAKNLNSSK